MTHGQFAAFWLAMLWHAIKLAGRRIHTLYSEKIRRQADRYYRIGRHSVRAQGLLHGRRATDIIYELRNQRALA